MTGNELSLIADAAVAALLVVTIGYAILLSRRLRAWREGAGDMERQVVALNDALSRATQVARSFGASAVLVVPGDLPQLLAEDVAALLALDGAGPRVVIAPDRHETGTNALLVRPPGWLAYAFGQGSFQAHQALAAEARAAVSVLRRPGLAFDLDTPEDWRLNREYTLAHIPLELTRRPL